MRKMVKAPDMRNIGHMGYLKKPKLVEKQAIKEDLLPVISLLLQIQYDIKKLRQEVKNAKT